MSDEVREVIATTDGETEPETISLYHGAFTAGEIARLIEGVYDTLYDARDLIPAEVGLETVLANLQEALKKARTFPFGEEQTFIP